MLERHWRRPFGRHSPQLGPTALLFLLHWASQALSCISSAPRQVAYGGARSPFPYGYSGGAGGGGGGPARPTIIVNGPGAVAGQARAAPNLPLNPIGTNGQLTGQSANALLGNRVAVAEFSSDGFNAQGGGPVPNGASLNCNFEADSHQCCWANVPTPSDDQIDWQLVQGRPDSQQFRNISMDSRYLVAYASGAAPSDEAQLSSCAVACASSPIRVRARHWQSYNVLLQVCQRESFPPSLGFNPLLNCQEFPSSSQVAHTELVLPKASFVDIIFVASNFIDERGDIVFLDDIEVLYESHPPECGGTPAPPSSGAQKSSKGKEPMKPAKSAAKNNGNRIGEEEEEENGIRRTKLGGGSSNGAIGGTEGGNSRGGVIRGGGGEAIGRAAAAGAGSAGAGLAGTHGQLKSIQTTGIDAQTTAAAAGTGIRVEGGGEEAIGTGAVDGGAGLSSQSGSSGGISSNSKAHGVAGKSGDLASSSSKSSSSLAASIKKTFASSASKSTATTSSKSSSSAASSSSSSSSSASSSAKKQQALISSSKACQSIRCSFEEGNSCAYLDTTESDSASAVRGLTTRFEVIKGQFMNRVTGVKEGTEGNFYAAVFLYPREKAGLWADIGGQLAEDTRLRFQYYEGTHGVQLKGCCARGGGEGNGGGKDDGRAEAEEELECPFQSDKFVSVSDRMWKWGSFVCPRGSRKVIFLCENTRTNQGACAMDDIAVVENRADINLQDKSIC